MASRRASVVSTAGGRQRKYSTDRLLRQAELSARLEEGRPLHIRPEQISEAPDENPEERLASSGIRSLTRADTVVSPFDFHPGRRVDSFALARAAGIDTSFDFGSNATKPWSEPSRAQQEDIERRAAITHRIDTEPLDLSPVHEKIYRALDTERPHEKVQNWFSRSRSKSQANVQFSLQKGLSVATAMNAALGLGFISTKAPDWLKRQQLHLLEYETSCDSKWFSCDAPASFKDTESLKHHLMTVSGPSPRFTEGKGVRLIHVRNNVKAFKYMDNAFVISCPDGHSLDRSFRDWMQEDRDDRRTSRMTIRWRPGFDTNRRVVCMAMGIDLGSAYSAIEGAAQDEEGLSQEEQSVYYKRRIAIYMQRSPSAAVPHPKVTQFNSRGLGFAEFAEQDNIVICEYSSDAWSEISSTPALLTLSPILDLDTYGPAAVMASAASHIFGEIVSKWQSQIHSIHTPFAELEDAVYSQPSDITHSSEVWEWSKRLQNMLKLVLRHLKAIQTFQDDFEVFAELDRRVEWLDDVLLEMKHVADTLKGDYIEPLEHMIDLMYKSVTIRDSRLSLELGTSLWRLSWITFIFLPLTFLVGFFGMNVDTFDGNPSIKWYFVALVPLAGIITSFWFAFNHFGSIFGYHDDHHHHRHTPFPPSSSSPFPSRSTTTRGTKNVNVNGNGNGGYMTSILNMVRKASQSVTVPSSKKNRQQRRQQRGNNANGAKEFGLGTERSRTKSTIGR